MAIAPAVHRPAPRGGAEAGRPLLEVRGLTKRFDGGRVVLDGVDLVARRGEVTAILGPNGSGKSTLLRCTVRLVEPSAGTVWIDGEELTALSDRRLQEARRAIAMVFQSAHLVRRRTALANAASGALGSLGGLAVACGRLPREALELGHRNLVRVGVEHVARQRAETLSGGQAQRVAIARALSQRPRVLLADEPVASLDPDATEEVMVLLRSLAADEGMAVVCVLHQPELARWHADRIVGLRAGRIVVDAPATEVDDAALTRLYRGHASSG
ncbi:MAG TPA: phosphonate ABC transporter ATP-binding protein [Candidatus Dormibacteraeota bacterium]|jgi:phosphonate transport system ATP-binding protein|nr:phosphonate ABC transporter ATP-binding protein [Candidatus Dormibacteraeota bacterium]